MQHRMHKHAQRHGKKRKSTVRSKTNNSQPGSTIPTTQQHICKYGLLQHHDASICETGTNNTPASPSPLTATTASPHSVPEPSFLSANCTVNWNRCLPLNTSTATLSPTRLASSCSRRSLALVTGLPSTPWMISPSMSSPPLRRVGRSPTCSAGEPGVTCRQQSGTQW